MVNNNAKSVIKQVLASGDTSGLLAAKDVGNVTRYIADFTAFPSVVEDAFTLTAANAGISVGSGTTAAADTDYQLVSTITSGLTGTVTSEKGVDASGNASITFHLTLTNTSSSNISISEIGYKQEISASDSLNGTTATDRVFLLDRSVFETITLEPNGQAAIDYTLKAAISNSGGVVGAKSITANGTYSALNDSLDGYSTVTVNVEPNVGTKNVTANGTYNASSDNYDGYSSVTVNVSGGNLGTKTITQNGTYNASSDNLDGYSQVTVNVSGGGSDILVYEFVTKSTGGRDASITVNKYLNGNLQSSTDYLYTQAQTPVNIDNRLTIDYGVTASLKWTYTLLTASLLNHAVGYTNSWQYNQVVTESENFFA